MKRRGSRVKLQHEALERARAADHGVVDLADRCSTDPASSPFFLPDGGNARDGWFAECGCGWSAGPLPLPEAEQRFDQHLEEQ